ncbi:MAG: RsiV family protein [bacterium]
MKKIFSFLLLFSLTVISVSAQQMEVTYKTISDNSSTMNYTVKATYPQVDFGPEALMGVRGIAQDINTSLDTTVNGIVNSFVNDVTNMPEKTVNGNGSSLEITSTGWIVNGSLLCSELTTFNNIAGMAHPMTTITTFNFVDNGAGPLALSSLFKSGSDYLNYISTESIQQLSAYAQKEGMTNISDMILSGASADAKNFTEWSISNESLNIIFNPYQVAPYVMGIQRVTIPLTSLISMLDRSGPAGFMIR